MPEQTSEKPFSSTQLNADDTTTTVKEPPVENDEEGLKKQAEQELEMAKMYEEKMEEEYAKREGGA